MDLGAAKLELYDLSTDPQQRNNLATQRPEVFQRLKAAYQDWFDDVSSSRPDNYAPPRIVIGTEHEPVSVLTRQDWRHQSGRPWGADSNGFWLVEAPDPGSYEVEIIFQAEPKRGRARITAGEARVEMQIGAGKKRGHSVLMNLPSGKFMLQVDVQFENKIQGPHQVILTKRNN